MDIEALKVYLKKNLRIEVTTVGFGDPSLKVALVLNGEEISSDTISGSMIERATDKGSMY